MLHGEFVRATDYKCGENVKYLVPRKCGVAWVPPSSFTQICGRVLPWPWPTLSPVYIRPGHGAAGAYYNYNYVDFPGASGKHSCCQRIHFPASQKWILLMPTWLPRRSCLTARERWFKSPCSAVNNVCTLWKVSVWVSVPGVRMPGATAPVLAWCQWKWDHCVQVPGPVSAAASVSASASIMLSIALSGDGLQYWCIDDDDDWGWGMQRKTRTDSIYHSKTLTRNPDENN